MPSKKPATWDILIHAMQFDVFVELFCKRRSRTLTPAPVKKHRYTYAKGLYTHYLFDSLEYTGDLLCNYTPFTQEYLWSYKPYDSTIILCLDSSLLKDQPFVVCDSTVYGRCVPYKQYQVMKSTGGRKRKPTMSRLKQHINRLLQPQDNKLSETIEYLNVVPFSRCMMIPRTLRFVKTHEVIFQKIPYSYIRGIVINSQEQQRFQQTHPGQSIIDYIRTCLPSFLQTIPIRLFDNTQDYKELLEPIANRQV